MFASLSLNKVYILLFLVVVFAGILRFYKVEQNPVSLYWDEVSSTYNAYSILKTGKDEFGTPHPLLFRAFEDYKTPANIYLTTIPVAIFGLNEFSARFTSAFLGTLTVLVMFFLVKEMFPKPISLTTGHWISSNYLALLASFFLATSPWSLQFSRTGFEANAGLFFVTLGATFFFRFINTNKSINLFLSSIVFAASIYFYRSIWVFTPMLVLSLILVYRKTLFSKLNIKKLLISGVIFLMALGPFVPVMISKDGLIRINQVNVVDNSFDQTTQFISNQKTVKGEIGKIVFNRRVAWANEIAHGYLVHFSQSFLFFKGDGNSRHGVTGMGVMYLWGALFIIPGIIALFKLDKRVRNTIILWTLIAPIPAAASVPVPHALRSLNMVPMPQILCALGIVLILMNLNRNKRIVFSLLTSFAILFLLVRYLFIYYGPYANQVSSSWGDGYKQLTQYVFTNESKYAKVVVSGHYWQPYIYFLFYKKYDPALFQKSGSKKGFDKYLFGGTSWDMNGKELGDQNLEKFAGTKNALIALSPVEYNLQKQNINIKTEIRNHNNEVVFIVGTLK